MLQKVLLLISDDDDDGPVFSSDSCQICGAESPHPLGDGLAQCRACKVQEVTVMLSTIA